MDHVLRAQVDLSPRTRLALNAAVPAAAVMAANALAMLFGYGANLPTFENQTAAPATWVTGALWIGLYGALGVARWEACHVSEEACDRSRWASVVLVWAMAYAFMAGAFGLMWGAIHAVSLFALAAMAFIRIAPTSRPAAAWLMGVMLWLGYTALLSVRALMSL